MVKYYSMGILSFCTFFPIFFISATVAANPNLLTFILIYIATILFSFMNEFIVSEIFTEVVDRLKLLGVVSLIYSVLSVFIALLNINNFILVFLVSFSLNLLFMFSAIGAEEGFKYWKRHKK